MNAVGDALHHFLALLLTRNDTEVDKLESLLHDNPAVFIQSNDICQCASNLSAWIDQQWPNATLHCELPLQRLLDTGQLQTGRIDLALATDKGWVLIDHKSNPRPASEWETTAQAYTGQLAAYATAVTALTGQPVLGTYIHFSVSIGLVEIVRE